MTNNISNKLPRVLVISCNCFHTQSSNGKTLISQFKNWPSDKIAQFYTYPEFSDYTKCERYFRITESDILSFRIGSRKTCGSVVKALERNDIESHVENDGFSFILRNFKNSNFLRLLRDFLWFGNKWQNFGLLDWADEFKPEIIYFLGINNPYLFRLAYNLADRYNIKIIVYTTDDYFLPRISLSISYWIRNIVLNQCMNKILKRPNSKLFTINEIMDLAYKERFKVDSKVFVNYVELKKLEPLSYKRDEKLTISYIGNLSHNRAQSISILAKEIALSKLNDKLVINVYCAEYVSENVVKRLNSYPNCHFMGSLKSEQIYQIVQDSDILLHVESFRYADRKSTILSFSTKLTEYIASGKPILAFAPSSVASMQILNKYDAAVCITNKKHESILSGLESILDHNRRLTIRENAWIFLDKLYRQNNMRNILSINKTRR